MDDLTLCLLVVPSVFFAWIGVQKYRRPPLPPGPPSLPVIGNLLNVPHEYEWLEYEKWGQQYGSGIVHLSVVGTHIIIVNSAKAGRDLFENRPDTYSDRPISDMIRLSGWDFNPGIWPYSPGWRAYRKLLHGQIGPGTMSKWHPKQKQCVINLLQRLLDAPQDFYHDIPHVLSCMILSVAYGLEAKSKEDPYIQVISKGNDAFLATTKPGHWIVDAMPLLRHIPEWFPGAAFARMAKESRAIARDFVEVPYAAAMKSPLDSIALGYPQSLNNPMDDKQEEILKGTLAVLSAAGVEATSGTIQAFFYEMMRSPHVQRRAQEELDRVLGGHRLPDFSDQDALPYNKAVIMELMRYHTVSVLYPRKMREADVYQGYYLPEGSVLLGNSWAMMHDETVYPDPHIFRPERFLDTSGNIDPAVPDPAHIWGIGRRVCPGRFLATDTIWLMITSILATFNVGALDNRQSRRADFSNTGLTRRPLPFECDIRPRSAEHAEVIRAHE